jgi:hypothetical protein
MAVLEVFSEVKHGNLFVYVTAEPGTHHSTIASAAYKHARGVSQPDYGVFMSPQELKPGKWCQPAYRGVWRPLGLKGMPVAATRKFFEAWPIPK